MRPSLARVLAAALSGAMVGAGAAGDPPGGASGDPPGGASGGAPGGALGSALGSASRGAPGGASVLAVFFTFSRSHFAVFEPLAARLVGAGHRLTLVSPYPLADPPGPYEHVDISSAKPYFNGSWPLDDFPRIPPGFLGVLSVVAGQAEGEEAVLAVPAVRALLDSARRFDLLLVEQFTDDLFAGFAGRFAAPLVLIGSCPPPPWSAGRLGAPAHPATHPNLYSGFTSRMDFGQRFVNLMQVAIAKLFHRLVLSPTADAAALRHFGAGATPPARLAERASLLLVNSHFSLLPGPTPLPPTVVEIGGIHVKESRRPHKVIVSSVDFLLTFTT